MRPQLDKRDIQLIAISPEPPERVAKGQKKQSSKLIMLSDEDLSVTEKFNLVNKRQLAPKPGMVVPLPIPTTFLVDKDGVVKWIDQSDDYQIRSHPDRVLAAIEENL